MRNDPSSALDALVQALVDNFPPEGSLLQVKTWVDQYEGEDWKVHVKFTDEQYARISLYRDTRFEILLLCWQPQQCTPIHAHPARGCLQKVLQGELFEERFSMDQGECFQSRPLYLGETAFIENALGTHRVSNVASVPAVSLHVYAPPGYEFTAHTAQCSP